MRNPFHRCVWLIASVFALLFSISAAHAADTLLWNTNQDRVTANIHSLPVQQVLQHIARYTGWQVFMESNATHTVSTKFQDLPTGDALHMLLGDLNFAFVPETNGPMHLYVFRTAIGNARQVIHPSDLVSTNSRSGKIPNELVVTLKPGAKIDGLPCLGNANITGHIDALHAYRVQFKNAADADAARGCLANNSDVASVESNYSMEQPDAPKAVANSAPQFNLTPKAPNGNSGITVGLIDTHVGTVSPDMKPFVLDAIDVAGDAPASADLTHGTAMLETIFQSLQANSQGSTSVKILPVDVYGPNETTSTFDVALGITEAINAGANPINLSLGGTGDSTILHQVIQSGYNQGIVFYAAAGNQPVATPVYPAAYPEVQAVTASGSPGQVADYANRGSFVDIMLPGTSIVPYLGGSWAVTGTSTATAYASGIAAGLADSSHARPNQVVPAIDGKFGVKLGSGQ
jgi:hypothetical protein